MSDDSGIDLSVFPEDIDIPSMFASSAETLSTDGGMTLIPFDFCLRFQGRPWTTLVVSAPSPQDAARTMDQFVQQVLNPTLVRMGYPPGICTWTAGAC